MAVTPFSIFISSTNLTNVDDDEESKSRHTNNFAVLLLWIMAEKYAIAGDIYHCHDAAIWWEWLSPSCCDSSLLRFVLNYWSAFYYALEG